MVRWAEAGVARVADAVGGVSGRLYTKLQFASRYPTLDADDYEELKACMPAEWKAALKRRAPAAQAAVERWLWRGDGLVERETGGTSEFFAVEPHGVRMRRATADEALPRPRRAAPSRVPWKYRHTNARERATGKQVSDVLFYGKMCFPTDTPFLRRINPYRLEAQGYDSSQKFMT